MNKTALKNFAIQARTDLRDKIKVKALGLGITEENIEKESLASSDAVFIDGRQLTIEEQSQRKKLIEEIKTKGLNQVIEEVAYTWFNRFTALRFMEVNNYLPTKVKVLSSELEGSYEPDIIKEALNIDLDIDKDLVYKLKTSNDNDAIDKLYKYLIIKQCNALNDILPLMFEKIMDYTELLFPDGLLADGSFLRVMTDTENIPEENWEEVEVLGWLYQYYISERKDEVFAGLKKKQKIQKDDIAPATQIFTPNWIVRYMVENSLGKLWQEGHPNEELQKEWKYYIEEADQDQEVQKELDKLNEDSKKIKIEDIKIIDPAMGSGHILIYAFDLLYNIYLSEGYIDREIPKLIIEKNLYGIDIDKRAFQLSYFALMMKGRAKSRRFFNESIDVNLVSIEESNEFPKEAINYFLRSKSLKVEKKIVEENLKYLIDTFHDAKEYGSILKVEKINFELIEQRLEEIRKETPEDMFELQYKERILDILPDLVKQCKIMSDKYDSLITNPPYMGSRGMNKKLSTFLAKEYPDTKADLFSVFMELDESMVKTKGYIAMINMESWMFLSTFENMRKKLLKEKSIDTLIHMPYLGKGGTSLGINFGTVAFVVRNIHIEDYKSTSNYIRYFETDNLGIPLNFPTKNERYNIFKKDDFNSIPGNPIAYWVTDAFLNNFNKGIKIEEISDYTGSQHITANNKKFIRYFWEPVSSNIGENNDWIFYSKGGEYRKYYGNNLLVVNWTENARSFYKSNSTSNLISEKYWYKEGITYTMLTSRGFNFRYLPPIGVFDKGGPTICYLEDLNYVLGLLNSKVASLYFDVFNPTLNLQVKDVKSLPIIINKEYYQEVEENVKQNVSLSKADWDSFETSWNFIIHPLLKDLDFNENNKLSENFKAWKTETNRTFNQLKTNEEEINRIFINIYGLEDELTLEVENKDVTITRIVERKSEQDKKNSYTIDRKQAIESFLSYAIGCMFGRYSLDEEGLAYAGGEFDSFKYKTFPADEDNIIPVLSDSYFEDDIVSNFEQFMKVTFGEENLNENFKYVADSLGTQKNESPKDTIRRYFINNFYKEHTRTYKKRPIYWMFSSGKEKAFNALIYMHRYDKSTLARIRTDYLHVLQSRLETERSNLQNRISEEDNAAQRKRYEKELKDLDKKIAELTKYDEKLHTMADQMIEIDLDDGVKVNYEKFKGLVQKI